MDIWQNSGQVFSNTRLRLCKPAFASAKCIVIKIISFHGFIFFHLHRAAHLIGCQWSALSQLGELWLSSLIFLSLKVNVGSGAEMKAGKTPEIRTDDLQEVRLANLGWEMSKCWCKLYRLCFCSISFWCFHFDAHIPQSHQDRNTRCRQILVMVSQESDYHFCFVQETKDSNED